MKVAAAARPAGPCGKHDHVSWWGTKNCPGPYTSIECNSAFKGDTAGDPRSARSRSRTGNSVLFHRRWSILTRLLGTSQVSRTRGSRSVAPPTRTGPAWRGESTPAPAPSAPGAGAVRCLAPRCSGRRADARLLAQNEPRPPRCVSRLTRRSRAVITTRRSTGSRQWHPTFGACSSAPWPSPSASFAC